MYMFTDYTYYLIQGEVTAADQINCNHSPIKWKIKTCTFGIFGAFYGVPIHVLGELLHPRWEKKTGQTGSQHSSSPLPLTYGFMLHCTHQMSRRLELANMYPKGIQPFCSYNINIFCSPYILQTAHSGGLSCFFPSESDKDMTNVYQMIMLQ